MSRALLIEPGTNQLQVVLQSDCCPATASAVTMTVTRMGMVCTELITPCGDPCLRFTRLETVVDNMPTKIYRANRIGVGFAVFVLDNDLREAPEGWYRALFAVEGCVIGELVMRVRYDRCGVFSCRIACS